MSKNIDIAEISLLELRYHLGSDKFGIAKQLFEAEIPFRIDVFGFSSDEVVYDRYKDLITMVVSIEDWRELCIKIPGKRGIVCGRQFTWRLPAIIYWVPEWGIEYIPRL